MNTIPLIFNERKVKRTVIAAKDRPRYAEIPVCAVLINELHQYRDTLLENLVKNTFSSIISIETVSDNYNIEHTARLFPTVTFIIVQEQATRGELINIAVEEAEEEYVLVLRDTLKAGAQVLSKYLFERIRNEQVFCAVPRLVGQDGQPVPVHYRPVVEKNRFKIDSSQNVKTVYTFDNIALYSKKKFMQLGGFDYTITSPYWQTLDLCVRSWLWGETMRVYSSFQLYYETDSPQEDISADASYLRFFLKNIIPVIKNDTAYIPVSSFFSFWNHSGYFWFEAHKQFAGARRWIEKNTLRFATDIHGLCDSWDDE
jgi:hypothetical protein